MDDMETRVRSRMEKFAFESEFKDWSSEYFSLKQESQGAARRPTSVRAYYVPKCKTTRRQNAPVYVAIEYLNKLTTTPEERR